MPIFHFRCEAQDDSGHFRQGSIEATSEETARYFLERRELDWAMLRLPDDRIAQLLTTDETDPVKVPVAAPDEDPAEFAERLEVFRARLDDELPHAAPAHATEEEKEPFRALSVRDRAHLNLHRQAAPYQLVTLEQVG